MKIEQTPSEQAKSAGLKSLAVVSRLTGYTEPGLYSCAKKRPKLFAIILLGCLAKIAQDEQPPH